MATRGKDEDMSSLEALKQEVDCFSGKAKDIRYYLMAQGFAEHFDDPNPIARAYAIDTLFTRHKLHIYENDLIAGSIRGRFSDAPDITDAVMEWANTIVNSYGDNCFNTDHFGPDYETFLADGVGRTIKKIQQSLLVHRDDYDAEKRTNFLNAAKISMEAFGRMIGQYADLAQEMAADAGLERREELLEIASACRNVAVNPPKTYREALQLIWMTQVAFVYEGRYAMAFGRLDQFLFPYYERDVKAGILTKEYATRLMASALYKIREFRYLGYDNVCNIAIGGIKRDRRGGVNEMSYVILEAVRRCNIPGPNLSARLYKGVPDEFLDACLQVIGTGLGYPALMNDEVNIPSLLRHGYAVEDCRDYCMVGCIENFIAGKQVPWSDGRYNTPKYIELALNNGKCMQTGVQMGPKTGEVSNFHSMEDFMAALRKQMEYGASEYMAHFRNGNDRFQKENYMQPFLSCFCRCCIERGLDINDGGSLYPSVHGAGVMGIATVADSLAAMETVIFRDRFASIETLRDALLADFNGYEDLMTELLHAPKYGNNNEIVDKYAVWFVDYQYELFSKYRTRDGGAIYIGIASNTSNIYAGRSVAATPDGRRNGAPVSDAASPLAGRDKNGPTSVVLSMTKPDYTKASLGTVLNQKYSPSMFSDAKKRAKLLELIKVYFEKGGQEIQINSVSRDILEDAMEHPENYEDLVVRVSGFSAYYTTLDKAIQKDILERTEHE